MINQVGAASLRATLNCDAFAREHSANSHFDKQSFVGLAWRPPHEDICCGTRFIPSNSYRHVYYRTLSTCSTCFADPTNSSMLLFTEIYSTGRAK